MNSNYYVYACLVDGEKKYIGKGRGNRLEHCKSGKSSCPELNRDFFAGRKMRTVILKDGLTQQEALALEGELIDSLGIENLYNKNASPAKINSQSLSKIIVFFEDIRAIFAVNRLVHITTFNELSTRAYMKLKSAGVALENPLLKKTREAFLSAFGIKKIRVDGKHFVCANDLKEIGEIKQALLK